MDILVNKILKSIFLFKKIRLNFCIFKITSFEISLVYHKMKWLQQFLFTVTVIVYNRPIKISTIPFVRCFLVTTKEYKIRDAWFDSLSHILSMKFYPNFFSIINTNCNTCDTNYIYYYMFCHSCTNSRIQVVFKIILLILHLINFYSPTNS